MTILGVILLVIVGLCALALALLCVTVSLRVVYRDALVLYAVAGMVKIKLYPRKEKEKKEKKKKKEKTETKRQNSSLQNGEKTKEISDSEKNNNAATQDKDRKNKKKSVLETASLIFDIIKQAAETFGKHGKIHVRRLLITVSRSDAADTAVQFGLACAAQSAALASCSLFGKAKIDEENVAVTPDFITGKSSLEADVQIGVRAIHLACAAIKIFMKKAVNNNDTEERKK